MVKNETVTSTRENLGYTTSISVEQPPEAVFASINNVRGWWSGEIQGETDQLGAEFTYRYKDVHQSKQKVVELVPGKKIGWEVLDGQLNSVENQSEWAGTKIVFEITEKNGKTEIRFTHIGLVPKYECYDSCSHAWQTLVQENLRKLIVTGQPQPDAFA